MAYSLFVDTWGWYTLRNKREAYHQEVASFYRDCRVNGGIVFTTDYVLDETLTLMFKRFSVDGALESMQIIMDSVEVGDVIAEWITPERFAHTQILRHRLRDKPGISFTDLTSMVVMQELGITAILTGDAHFTHVGMGFQPVP